jgi:hypothetical protein
MELRVLHRARKQIDAWSSRALPPDPDRAVQLDNGAMIALSEVGVSAANFGLYAPSGMRLNAPS